MLSDRLKDYQRSRRNRISTDSLLSRETKSLEELRVGKPYRNGSGIRGAGGSVGSRSEDVSSRISYSSSLASGGSKTKSDYVQTLRSQNGVCRRRELISERDDFEGEGFPDFAKKKRGLEDPVPGREEGFQSDNSPASRLKSLNKKFLVSHKYYDILELQPGSSLESIKKAYRKKASKLHPDKLRSESPDQKEQNLARFRQVQESYEFLSDPNKKEVYDEYGDDIIKYGFLDHWTKMKGSIFETKVPSYSEASMSREMASSHPKYSNALSDWEVFWQELLVYLFFKPILNKSCIELRDLPPMNLSVPSYRTLISNSYAYLRRFLSMPSRFFGTPVDIHLDPQVIHAADKALPPLKKGLFSRFASNFSSPQNSKPSNSFFNAQIVGPNPRYLLVNKETVSLISTSRNISSGADENAAFGVIFCENKQGWIKFLSLAEREFKNKGGNGNNFKRRLKEIQAEFDWVVLAFLSEEQLPTQDQELLLDYYNIKDDIKDAKSTKDPIDLEIMEHKMDNSHCSDLFPCLVHKPKHTHVSSKCNSEPSYSRPSNAQINQIIKQLELLSNVGDDDSTSHPSFSFILSDNKEAPCVGNGGKSDV